MKNALTKLQINVTKYVYINQTKACTTARNKNTFIQISNISTY